MNASDEQRNNYEIGFTGFHWRELDEDISFESFEYADAIPSKLQEFFLVHKEINVAKFAKRIGINATLLRNYINGFKKPSVEREADALKIMFHYNTIRIMCCIIMKHFLFLMKVI